MLTNCYNAKNNKYFPSIHIRFKKYNIFRTIRKTPVSLVNTGVYVAIMFRDYLLDFSYQADGTTLHPETVVVDDITDTKRKRRCIIRPRSRR